MAAAVPFIALGLGAVGTIASAEGQLQAGRAQQQAASYQAQVARNNATIANQNAAYAAQAGSEAATQESMKNAAKLSRMRAAQAANGLDVNTGSPVAVRATEAETGALDTATVSHNALLQAYGYRTQATNDTAQAGLYQNEADEAMPAADLAATGSLLGGASSLGFKWTQLNPKGS